MKLFCNVWRFIRQRRIHNSSCGFTHNENGYRLKSKWQEGAKLIVTSRFFTTYSVFRFVRPRRAFKLSYSRLRVHARKCFEVRVPLRRVKTGFKYGYNDNYCYVDLYHHIFGVCFLILMLYLIRPIIRARQCFEARALLIRVRKSDIIPPWGL